MMKVYAYLLENGTLCWTIDKAYVPVNVQAEEFEVDDPHDLTVIDGRICKKTKEQKLNEQKQFLLMLLKSTTFELLSPTDYILAYITEAEKFGDEEEVARLKEKYRDKIAKRRQIRQWYEETKQKIEQAKSEEELQAISIQPPNL